MCRLSGWDHYRTSGESWCKVRSGFHFSPCIGFWTVPSLQQWNISDTLRTKDQSLNVCSYLYNNAAIEITYRESSPKNFLKSVFLSPVEQFILVLVWFLKYWSIDVSLLTNATVPEVTWVVVLNITTHLKNSSVVMSSFQVLLPLYFTFIFPQSVFHNVPLYWRYDRAQSLFTVWLHVQNVPQNNVLHKHPKLKSEITRGFESKTIFNATIFILNLFNNLNTF